MMRKKSLLSRRLGFQSLESRQLLAAEISELLIRGDDAGSQEQAIELRGEPGAALSEGTFLVVTDDNRGSRDALPVAGQVNYVFDLSGLSFGANGYLVLLQHESPHQVNADATVVQSTSDGFNGLPGGIYSAFSGNDGFSIVGNHSFLLIESPQTPQLDEYIDANIDGVIDAPFFSDWVVLDSISMHFGNFAASALAKTVFISDLSGDVADAITAPGAEVQIVDRADYAALRTSRPSDSPEDWLVGGADTNTLQADDQLRVSLRSVEQPTQRSVSGSVLNHFGAPNFYGSVVGSLSDQEMNPVAGETVFLDTNGNGLRDNLLFAHQPEDVLPSVPDTGQQYQLTSEYPGIATTIWRSDSYSDWAHARWDDDAVVGQDEWVFGDYVFNDALTENRKLRVDFERPVNRVSYKYVGYHSAFLSTIGRLEAYDSAGNLIQESTTGALRSNQSTLLTVSTTSDEISYILAFNDPNGETDLGGRFDDLRYQQYEPQATTDDVGGFVFDGLTPGTYRLTGEVLGELSEPREHIVTETETVQFDVTVGPPPGPVITDASFELDENNAGVTLGRLEIQNFDPATIEFSIEDSESPFEVEPSSGVISAKLDANLDFESQNLYRFFVSAEDADGQNASAEVTVSILDVNEAPVLDGLQIEISENTFGRIGSVSATDPDFGQQHFFELLDQETALPFLVSTDGSIQVKPGEIIDFEEAMEYSIPIRVTDSGTPALTGEGAITVMVSDQNEAPSFSSFEYAVPENTSGTLFTIAIDDEDIGQTHRFELVGGTGQDWVEVSETGEVTVLDGLSIDHEVIESLILVVRAVDSGDTALAIEQSMLMSITDVDEPPMFTGSIDGVTVQTGERFATGIWESLIDDPEGDRWNIELEIGGSEIPAWMRLGGVDAGVDFGVDGVPTSFWVGTHTVNARVVSQNDPEVFSDLQFDIEIVASESPLHNATLPEDVNGDRVVSPIDALTVLNYISQEGDGTIDHSARFDAFPDVGPDNLVTPLDALRVINYLAREAQDSSGEAERLPVFAVQTPSSVEDHDEVIREWIDDLGLF